MKNSDQPAFPTQDTIHPMTNERYGPLNIGLTKREYFAGLALQGLCANYLRDNVTGWDIKTYAVESVALADAILKQLES